jgi:sulfonate transport system substrate-binding protein
VASEAAILRKRDVLAAYVQRVNQALRWGLSHTDGYATAWAAETGVPVDVSRETLQARGFVPAPVDAAMIADQQRTVDLYAREGVLPLRYDTASAFDPSFNES